MFKKIRNITLQMTAGANVATIVLMLLVGYSDRLDPVEHPILANAGLAFPVFLFINFCFLVFFLVFRKKYALVPIAGFMLGYQPIRTYCPLNIRRDVPAGAIKVLSYNVHGFVAGKSSDDGSNPILDYIIGSDADIVCLQEARLDGRILNTIKGVYDYADSVIHPAHSDCLVLFSKFPIVSKERIEYKSKGNLSAAFKVVMGGDTVTVVNNHFETTGLSLKQLPATPTPSVTHPSPLWRARTPSRPSRNALRASSAKPYAYAHRRWMPWPPTSRSAAVR